MAHNTNRRIEETFAALRTQKRAALIPFIMGYDPDAATTSALLDKMAEKGADIIEIGIPFSDPMADGKVIQQAGRRALNAGATVAGILELVRDFRTRHASIPIILMGYYNPVYRYGGDKFCKDAAAAGVDGIILVDLPPEEEEELRPALDANGLNLIRLIAPTSGDNRLKPLCDSAGGFVYYISIAGITGAQTADPQELKAKVQHLKEFTPLPVAVGFGIKTAEQVAQVAKFADAVVVGSALVEVVATQASREKQVKAAGDFISSLAKGLAH